MFIEIVFTTLKLFTKLKMTLFYKGKYKIQKKKERNMMQVCGDERNQEEYGRRHLSNKPNRPAQNYRSGVRA
jgi:hypothetical protein